MRGNNVKSLNVTLLCSLISDEKRWIEWKYAIQKCPNFDVCTHLSSSQYR